MVDPKLQKELLNELARLSQPQQQKVIAFAKNLSAAPASEPGKHLARFAGMIDPADLKEMAAAIEESCERIDKSEW